MATKFIMTLPTVFWKRTKFVWMGIKSFWKAIKFSMTLPKHFWKATLFVWMAPNIFWRATKISMTLPTAFWKATLFVYTGTKLGRKLFFFGWTKQPVVNIGYPLADRGNAYKKKVVA